MTVSKQTHRLPTCSYSHTSVDLKRCLNLLQKLSRTLTLERVTNSNK